MMRKKNLSNKVTLFFGVMFCLAQLVLSIASPPQASAVSGGEFNPARIIDDGLFFNPYGMTTPQIQEFLNSKVPVCDTSGAQAYAGTTRAAYGASRGYPAPYTCLRDYVQNIPGISPDAYCGGAVSAGWKTAATIIKDVALACNVSPQVILVTLQKEQGLITDDWPWSVQYTKATGMGCPDSALGVDVDQNQNGCYDDYEGFFKQIYYGARQFQRYVKQPGSFNYAIGRTSFVSYQANNPGCGGTNITPQTQATAALYNYTPYQPNAAALNNLYGTGDGCSAYGNRNFWRMWQDWFGPTTVGSYEYQFVSSTSSLLPLDYGQQTTGSITLRNIGNSPWYADGAVPPNQKPTRLGIINYYNTWFADTSDPNWLGTRNQIKMTPALVNPGENATFSFSVVGPYGYAPLSPITFIPLVDGLGWMRNSNMQFLVGSNAPRYQYISALVPPAQIIPGQEVNANLVIKNTGNGPWYADGATPSGKKSMRLADLTYANNPYASSSDPSWLGTKNQVKMTPALVNPGQNATFSFKLVGTPQPSTYNFRFLPVLDGVTFLQDYGMAFALKTVLPSYTYQFVSATNPPSTMAPGSIASVSLQLRNTGTATWKNETTRTASQTGVRLVMAQPWYRSSAFRDPADTNWLTAAQIGMTTPEVAPGQVGTFTFSWKAPLQTGTYTEYFAPVADGVTLMHDISMGFLVKVQ